MSEQSVSRIQVVSAIIIQGGRILLTQRRDDDRFAFRWCTPGGKVNAQEPQRKALMRELLEEIDADVEVREEVHDAHIDPPIVEKPLLVTHYTAKIMPDSLRAYGKERQGFGWFTAKQLRALDLTPADERARPVLLSLLANDGAVAL